MSEEVQFTCELCGRSFDPTPDAMVEWEMQEEWAVDGDVKEFAMTKERLESLNEWELKEMKLTDETRDALLAGKVVTFGGCVCLTCQNEMASE